MQLIALLLSFILLFGCAGNDEPSKQQSTQYSPEGQSKQPASGQPSATPQKLPDDKVGKTIASYLGIRQLSEYHTSYSTKTEFSGTTVPGTMEIFASNGMLRIDSVQSMMGTQVRSSIFHLANGSYMCMSFTNAAKCYSGPMPKPIYAQLELPAEQFDFYSKPGVRYGGMDAKCNLVAPLGEKTGTTICYSDSGILAYLEGVQKSEEAGDVKLTMELLSVGSAPADSDFILPAPVSELDENATGG
jgi:hypothetical protein